MSGEDGSALSRLWSRCLGSLCCRRNRRVRGLRDAFSGQEEIQSPLSSLRGVLSFYCLVGIIPASLSADGCSFKVPLCFALPDRNYQPLARFHVNPDPQEELPEGLRAPLVSLRPERVDLHQDKNALRDKRIATAKSLGRDLLEDEQVWPVVHGKGKIFSKHQRVAMYR